jgi:glycosyltransferase involved in cell wall biosynthesis
MPVVSVVIPAYNAARFLPDALDSVLAQTFRDLEVLVIDDGSTDATPETLARYRSPVRCIRQSNAGVSTARNRGIAEACGRYVAFLDADDTWMPHRLENQMKALAQHPECGACFSAFTFVREDLTPLAVSRREHGAASLAELLLHGNVVGSGSTVLCLRAVFDAAGAFDPALSQCADWDMWVRLAARTDFLYLDEPLATYRQHATNMSRDAARLERDSLRVLERGFAMPGLPPSVLSRERTAYARNYMVLAGCYFHARRCRDFVRCAALAVAMDPRQVCHLVGFPLRSFARAARSLVRLGGGPPRCLAPGKSRGEIVS